LVARLLRSLLIAGYIAPPELLGAVLAVAELAIDLDVFDVLAESSLRASQEVPPDLVDRYIRCLGEEAQVSDVEAIARLLVIPSVAATSEHVAELVCLNDLPFSIFTKVSGAVMTWARRNGDAELLARTLAMLMEKWTWEPVSKHEGGIVARVLLTCLAIDWEIDPGMGIEIIKNVLEIGCGPADDAWYSEDALPIVTLCCRIVQAINETAEHSAELLWQLQEAGSESEFGGLIQLEINLTLLLCQWRLSDEDVHEMVRMHVMLVTNYHRWLFATAFLAAGGSYGKLRDEISDSVQKVLVQPGEDQDPPLRLEAIQLFDEFSWPGADPPGFMRFSDGGRPP
jgi:hypothetical protein